jgi:hypothetical protein
MLGHVASWGDRYPHATNKDPACCLCQADSIIRISGGTLGGMPIGSPGSGASPGESGGTFKGSPVPGIPEGGGSGLTGSGVGLGTSGPGSGVSVSAMGTLPFISRSRRGESLSRLNASLHGCHHPINIPPLNPDRNRFRSTSVIRPAARCSRGVGKHQGPVYRAGGATPG